MRNDILSAIELQSGRAERPGRSCALVGKDTAEDIGIGIGWNSERPDSNKAVQCISVSQETAILGQSFLGERLLC